MNEYDVIVVGAGPAGSAAAKAAAGRGAKTVLLEEHTEIGVPTHCNGVIPPPLVDLAREILHTMGQRVVLREFRKARVYAPSGKVVKSVPIPPNTLFLVDRAQFDRELARQAVNAGADLILNTRVNGLLKRDGRVVGVTTGSAANPEIYGKVVIAADGINAIQKGVPKWAGLTPINQRYWGGISFELTRVRGLEPDTVELHTGAFTKKGHLTITPRDEVSCMTHFETLDEFRQAKLGNYALSKKLKDAVPLKMVGYRHTWDLGERLPKIIDNGLILTGSAANWRGTIISIALGIYAGQVASEAVVEDDVTEKKLSKYEELLAKIPGKGYQFKSKMSVFPFYQRSDDEIEELLLERIDKGTLNWPPQ
jgi:digeranylgeranylglycerophospholipid reductase